MARCHVLLLGGIGSGKSTVARLLSDRGMEIINADEIGHDVLEDLEVVEEVAAEWPSVIVAGVVDRGLVADIVFADKKELLRLESITHPRIRQRLNDRVAAARADFLVVEMPLLSTLVDGNWFRVVVDAPSAIRLDRLVSRGMSAADAQTRIDLQPNRSDYLAAADYVIDNGGSERALQEAVDRLVDTLEACSAGRSSEGPTSGVKNRILYE